MKKHLRWLALFFILTGCNNDQPLTTHERGFDEAKIDYYNTSERYNYDRIISQEPNPVLQALSTIIGAIAWILNTIFGYIMIAILVVLLIWVLFRYVNQERVSYNNDRKVLRLVDESAIDEIDFNKLISKALANKNYRLAIRYTFLNTLKGLSLNQLITVKEGKTNYEYYRELPDALKGKYRQVLSVFEYVWYGEFDSSLAIYEQINHSAQELQDLIKKADA
jgi:hypothetical protein